MSKNTLIIRALIILLFLFGVGIYLTFDKPQSNEPPTTVTWDRAVEILNSAEVKEVFQSHSLEVRFILEDGSRIETTEPNIDDIFDEVQQCGDPCDNIIMATE